MAILSSHQSCTRNRFHDYKCRVYSDYKQINSKLKIKMSDNFLGADYGTVVLTYITSAILSTVQIWTLHKTYKQKLKTMSIALLLMIISNVFICAFYEAYYKMEQSYSND